MGRTILVLAVLVLPCPACGGGQREAASDARFTFSADPTEVVLLVAYKGGLTGKNPRYALHGDGRLEITVQDHHGEAFERHDVQLSFLETEELVRLAVDHGLMEVKGEDLYQRMRTDSGGRSFNGVVQDASDMIVEVHLDSYSRNGEDVGALENQVRFQAPGQMIRIFPQYPELQGLVELGRRMKALRLHAQEKAGER